MDASSAKQQYDESKRLFRAGRFAEALDILERLDVEIPGSKNVLLAKAECFAALGQQLQARAACEQVLAYEDDARARRILARCDGAVGVAPDGGAAAAKDWQPINPEHNVSAERSHRSRLSRYLYTLPAIAILGAAAAIVSVRYVRGQLAEGPSAPAFTEEEIAATGQTYRMNRAVSLARDESVRAAVAARAEAKRVTDAEADSKRPGYVIPESEWNLDPVTGVPAWRPGIYRQLPCPGSWFEPWQGPRTLDMYIPMAYAARPEELFPTLSITMPKENPGFLGLESWAERRAVILVVVNTSSNAHHPGGNTEAQIAAMNFLYGYLRAHPTLNFATGTSGGARMALHAAARWPDAIAGVLLMAHSGDDLPLSPHLRIAIIHGRDDFNARAISQHVPRLRAAGFDLRYKVIPGGHITAPPSEQVKMLDWMLDAARRDLEAAERSEV